MNFPKQLLNNLDKEAMEYTKNNRVYKFDRACWGAEYHSQEWYDEVERLESEKNEDNGNIRKQD